MLGAGLTGLSAGLELERRRATYRVFEKSATVGGHAITIEDSGYRFDRTGHLLHLRSDALRNEVLEWLDHDCLAIERRSVVFSHGVYTRYPFQANTHGLPPAVAYDCLMGFLATLTQPKLGSPQNFEEFSLSHFGPGFTEHFMRPYNEKLWGVSAREISATWCQRFVPLPKLEDVMRGALGVDPPALGYNARFLYPRRGIGALPEALAKRVPNLERSSAPRQIRLAKRELWFEQGTLGYDTLISSIPLPTLLSLCDELPADVRDAARKLRATHLYYLDVALNGPNPKGFHWAYVPEPKYPFYRVGCYSHFSPELAPPGKASLYVELSAREEPPLARLLAEVTPGLIEMGVLGKSSDIAFARLRRLDHAYVIYDHDYEQALSVIRPFLAAHGVLSTGRYGGWNYSSMEDALLFGRAAVSSAFDANAAR